MTAKNQVDPRRARQIIMLLAACVALLMTGFGIIMPVFPRRLAELGAGVEALGLMTTAFMLAQLIFAPIMGGLADRFGRKPVILLSLIAFIFAQAGYLLAATTTQFIAVRALQGALTSGLFPATLGMVGDLFPEKERARWIGIVAASYTAGFIFGPTIGGILFDVWGFTAPFITSAVLALLALVATAIVVPETRPREVREQDRRREKEAEKKESLWSSLPRPLTLFGTLLLIDFTIIFTFAFVEPELVFYMYDDLGWTTTQFGIIVGVYALTTASGQLFAGPISDRFPRKRIIITGLLLNALLYLGIILFIDFYTMLVVAAVAGIGEALLMPALSAYYLSITADEHRGRVMGFKESAAASGGVLGPLLVAGLSGLLTSMAIFAIAFAMMTGTAVVALLFLRKPLLRAEKAGAVLETPGDPLA